MRGTTGTAPVLSSSAPSPEATGQHIHVVPGRTSWPWLPTMVHRILVPHPFCVDCGSVKSIGPSRPLDLGGLTNLLGRLERVLSDGGVRITEAQRRLIVRRFQTIGADDQFTISRESQLHLVAEVVGAHLGLPPHAVQSYLRSC